MLTMKEERVYKAVLRYNMASNEFIAHILNFDVDTVNMCLESLIKRGLVSEVRIINPRLN